MNGCIGNGAFGRRAPWPLFVILILHGALGLAFGWLTPLFEAPDEANHFLFIRYLQLHQALPVQTLDQNGPRAHHPPLYFVLAALISAWVPHTGPAEAVTLPENSTIWFRYGDPALDHKVKYIHSSQEQWPFRDLALAVHVIRGLSVVFSTLAVGFTYQAARLLWPDNFNLAYLAAGLLAFNPMVLFMSGVVQNSTAALASSAGLMLVLSQGLRFGFTPWRWLGVGLIWSLAILVQTSGLALGAAVLVALLVDTQPALSLKSLIYKGGLVVGVVGGLTSWWFVRNHWLYGDWTANAIVGALWSDQPIMPFEQTWHLLLTGMVGRFGFGLIIEYADWIYRLAWGWVAVAGVGGCLGLYRAWRAKSPTLRLSSSARLWELHALTVSGVALALAIYIIGYIRGGHDRYMFSAYPSLMLLLAGGTLMWFRHPSTLQTRWTWVSLSLWLALSVYGLLGLVVPAYAPPRSPSTVELAQMMPVEANLGGAVRVMGYQAPIQIRAGETLAVTIYWQPLDYTDRPYTVFVHLLDAEGNVLSQADTYPGDGHWVTTTWEIGRIFADTYRLPFPVRISTPTTATLVLGLYDAPTGERLPVIGNNAGQASETWVRLGEVTIVP